MANESPEQLQLLVAVKKNLSRCIICQKIQDNKGSKNLTGTEREGNVLVAVLSI